MVLYSHMTEISTHDVAMWSALWNFIACLYFDSFYVLSQYHGVCEYTRKTMATSNGGRAEVQRVTDRCRCSLNMGRLMSGLLNQKEDIDRCSCTGTL